METQQIHDWVSFDLSLMIAFNAILPPFPAQAHVSPANPARYVCLWFPGNLHAINGNPLTCRNRLAVQESVDGNVWRTKWCSSYMLGIRDTILPYTVCQVLPPWLNHIRYVRCYRPGWTIFLPVTHISIWRYVSTRSRLLYKPSGLHHSTVPHGGRYHITAFHH